MPFQQALVASLQERALSWREIEEGRSIAFCDPAWGKAQRDQQGREHLELRISSLELGSIRPEGLNNGTWSQQVMAGVTSAASTVTAAKAMIDNFAAIAEAPATSELVVKIQGIVV